jgi:hypothetical protein
MSVLSLIKDAVVAAVKKDGATVVGEVLAGGGNLAKVGTALAGIARDAAEDNLLSQIEKAGITPTAEGYGLRIQGDPAVKAAFNKAALSVADRKAIGIACAGATMRAEENDLRRLAKAVRS